MHEDHRSRRRRNGRRRRRGPRLRRLARPDRGRSPRRDRAEDVGGQIGGRRSDVRARGARPWISRPAPAAAAARDRWPTGTGNLYLMYRAATAGVERDMYLLIVRRTMALTSGRSRSALADRDLPDEQRIAGRGRLRPCSRPGRRTARSTSLASIANPAPSMAPISPPGRAGYSQAPGRGGKRLGRDDPRLDRGHRLAERRRARLAGLRSLPASPNGERGLLDGGVPVWSLATVVARPDGGFVVIH